MEEEGKVGRCMKERREKEERQGDKGETGRQGRCRECCVAPHHYISGHKEPCTATLNGI